MNEYRFEITPRLTCEGCFSKLRTAVSQVDGVADITLDVDPNVVWVEARATRESVARAIGEAGFTVAR